MASGDDVIVTQQVATGLVNVRGAVHAICELAAASDVLYPLTELLGVQRVPGAARQQQRFRVARGRTSGCTAAAAPVVASQADRR